MTTDLPSRWASVTLGDVFIPRKGKHTPGPSDRRPYLSLDNIESHTSRITAWERSSDYSSQSSQLFAGDIAYARLRPYLNKIALIDREALGSAEFIVLPRMPEVLPSFLCYRLLSPDFVRFADQHSTGDRPRLKWAQMRDFPLGLPPFAEQKRIVDAIEEYFSRLAAVDANLRSVVRRADILEQVVIDQANEGDRHRLGDRLSEPLRNGCSPPRSSDGNTRVLTLTAVTNRAFTEESTRTAVISQKQRDQLMLQPGDILVQRSNTPELVGTAALYPGPSDWAVFPDLLIRVRPDRTLLSAYLELVLRSSEARRHFRLSARGIAGSMPKISQRTIEELEISIPASVAEQQTIVRRVSSEIDAVKEVQDSVSRACKRADWLRRAVLATAFAGRLVPQNPYDEPASVSLERIATFGTTKPNRQKVRA